MKLLQYIAVLFLPPTLCQCSVTDPWVISAAMRQFAVSSIAASKYSEAIMSLTDCLLLCAGHAACVYMTFDDDTSQCSFYALGTAVYDVSTSHLYAAERKTECSLSPCVTGMQWCSIDLLDSGSTYSCPCSTFTPGSQTSVTVPRVAFSASSNSSWVSPGVFNKVTFNSNTLNDGGGFSASKFTPVQTGLYWLHWCAAPGNVSAQVTLQGGPRMPNMQRVFSDFPSSPTTLSRSELVQLQQGSTALWLSSLNNLYSDQYQQTAFAGFMLDNTMNPLVAFYVSQSATAAGPKMPYNVLLVDTLGAWNGSSYEYVVPLAGTYVVSVMFGIINSTANGNLLVNSAPTSPLYGYTYAATTQQDFISTTFVICLNTDDRLSVRKPSGGGGVITFDFRSYHNAFMGFLYSPSQGQKVAWSVGRASTDASDGPLNPVTYSVVFVNAGSAWSVASNTVTLTLAGVYYVSVSALSQSLQPLRVEVAVNGVAVASVQMETPLVLQYAFSRSVLVRLQRGDDLRVRLAAACSLSADIYSTFSGIRIYS